MHRAHVALIMLLPLATVTTPRSDGTSSPKVRTDTTRTRELVAVYIGMKRGIGENLPGLNKAVDSMNRLLGARARERGDEFVSVGVALDPVAEEGYNYLRSVSRFSEYVVGHGWMNLAAQHYIWADTSLASAVPQVIVFEREVLIIQDVDSVGGREIKKGGKMVFGDERVLARLNSGWTRIVEWVNAGASLR